MTKSELYAVLQDLNNQSADTLRTALRMSKASVGSTRRAVRKVDTTGMSPEKIAKLKPQNFWGTTPAISRLEENLSRLPFVMEDVKDKDKSVNQLREELRQYKQYFLGSPGYGTPTTTSVAGYRSYLEKYEKDMGMPGYSRWSEDERKDFWNLIDDIRAAGMEDFFTPGYESGRWIQSIWQWQTSDSGLRDQLTGEQLAWTHENVMRVMRQMFEQESRDRSQEMPNF